MAKAKNNNPAQPTTDSVQAASVAPPETPETPAADSATSVQDPGPVASPSADATKDEEESTLCTYLVNWRLEGFQGQAFNEGDILESDPEEAGHLVECGVLSPVVVEVEG